ncbi:MAG: efflux RND transporter permease subunit [Planctomycetota bacterium]
MSLSAFAMRNRAIVTSAVAILMAWGVMTYLKMPRRENPEFTVMVCVVQTSWPGTPAKTVEELITAPLEEELTEIAGLRWIYSESVVGSSSVFVELSRDTQADDVDQAWDAVRARVDKVAMPEPHIKPVVIDDFGDESVFLVAVHQIPMPGENKIRDENRYSPRDLEIFSDRLKDELLLVEGVAKVALSGVRNEAIYIETDAATYAQLKLRSDELTQKVEARNVIAAGGTIDTTDGRFSIKPTGDLDAVQELQSIVVDQLGLGDARVPVYLTDLNIDVVRGYQDPATQICRYGEPAGSTDSVVVHFTMDDGANITTVCAAARERIDELTRIEKVFPPDLAITPVLDSSITVDRKIGDFVWNVIGAIAIVVAVVYLIVGFRSSAVMGANIPLVIIGSLALITLFGVQMEQISLAAMIIALGMLVDNAVQICDQSRRLQSEGLPRFKACVQGANELAFPVFIATLTTVAAFYPMLLGLKASTKEYIYSLPVTITVTLLLSYVIAMTFCVILTYWFIRAPEDPEAPISPLVILWQKIFKPKPKTEAEKAKPGIYEKLAAICIKAKWLVVGVSFGLLAVVMMLPVGSEFFPRDLRDQFAVEIWLSESATIAQTDEAAKQVESLIRKLSAGKDAQGNAVERLDNYRVLVGGAGARWYLGRNPEAMKPNYAEVLVHTTDGSLTNDFAQDIRRVATEGDVALGIKPLSGIRVIPRQLVMGPAVASPVEFRIFGPRLGSGFADMELMRDAAADLTDILGAHPGAWDVFDSWGSKAFEMNVEIDSDKANLAGVTNIGVANTLNSYYSGHYVTTFREADHQIPVYLRLPPRQRGDIDALRSAYVEGAAEKVPLDAVAEITPMWVPAKIDRRYLMRKIDVRARVNPGYLSNDIANDVINSQKFKDWEAKLPPGYWWMPSGDLYESSLTGKDLQKSIMISLLAIIMLLIIQFNGIAKPFIIITTLPLAMIGAYGGLFLMGYPMGFMAQLGLLSLFGIVVNAAIIFIDFADRLIEEKIKASDGTGPIQGMSRDDFHECLIRAGKVRLLPIAMTTLTTIGGLLPLGLAGGPLWEGMAWLMIYGLAIGTVLTLIVVPALYAIMVEVFKVKPVAVEPEGA